MLDCDNDVLYDAFVHLGKKRRSRLKGYYVCLCGWQYIYNSALKERICTSCRRTLHLLSTIDEFEENRIKKTALGSVILQDKIKLKERNA